VDHHRVAADRIGEEELGVDRPGLVLEGEEQIVVVVDDPAAGGERVGVPNCWDRKSRISPWRASEPSAISPKVGEAGSSGSTCPLNKSGSIASYIRSPEAVR
jgi:hypothetical protein